MEGKAGTQVCRSHLAPPEWQSPNPTLLSDSVLCESVALWTSTFGLWEEDSLGSRGRSHWALGRNSGQDRAHRGCDQSRLGPGFLVFFSLILSLLSFLILSVLHLVWPWRSHSPTTRVPSSKRRSSALTRKQKEAEDFSKGYPRSCRCRRMHCPQASRMCGGQSLHVLFYCCVPGISSCRSHPGLLSLQSMSETYYRDLPQRSQSSQ